MLLKCAYAGTRVHVHENIWGAIDSQKYKAVKWYETLIRIMQEYLLL